MTTWVVLLRGINVGGGNQLAMADLRRSVEGIGYERVRTYIQSGNLVFDGDDGEADTAERIRSVLVHQHGLQVPLVVRTAAEIARASMSHPDSGGSIPPKFLHVAFLDRAPESAAVLELEPDRWSPDRWRLDGRELYLSYPDGSGRSKMTIDRFERPWSVTATARNLTTVAKLADIASSRG